VSPLKGENLNVSFFHDYLRLLALAGMHPVYLVGLHLLSSIMPVDNYFIYNGMIAA
jgi:hypothetical protein